MSRFLYFIEIVFFSGPPNDKHPKLYFHSLASVRESYVSTAVLKDLKTVSDPVGSQNYFHHSGDIRPGQGTVEVMTPDGILVYTVLPKNGLACWNTAKPLEKRFQFIIYEVRDKVKDLYE